MTTQTTLSGGLGTTTTTTTAGSIQTIAENCHSLLIAERYMHNDLDDDQNDSLGWPGYDNDDDDNSGSASIVAIAY